MLLRGTNLLQPLHIIKPPLNRISIFFSVLDFSGAYIYRALVVHWAIHLRRNGSSDILHTIRIELTLASDVQLCIDDLTKIPRDRSLSRHPATLVPDPVTSMTSRESVDNILLVIDGMPGLIQPPLAPLPPLRTHHSVYKPFVNVAQQFANVS
jgi:hypothetical protein